LREKWSMSQKRSSRKEQPPIDLSAELDDMLAAPALRPSLRFLGLESEGDPLTAPPAVIPIRPPLTAPPAVITSPADIASPADTASPAVIPPEKQNLPNEPKLSTTAPPADIASPAVNRSSLNPRKRIYRCVKVQDGHSHVEQAVYQILWNSGAPQPDGNRVSRVGLPRLAKEACVHERNIGTIIRRLIAKKAIEIVQREVSDLRASRIYKVYGYRDILERRKKAGLEWVVRGRGVEFVHPDTGIPFPFEDSRITAGDAIPAGGGDAVTAGDSPAITAPPSPAVTAGLKGINLLGKLQEETSSSGNGAVAEEFRKHADVDDDAVTLLIDRCKAHAADCTAEEIVHFLRRKTELLAHASIGNPTGFLLTAVPKCFTGESFRLFREERERQRRQAEELRLQQEREVEEWRREQERLLADPDASEDEKRWARTLLGLK
jgi:predicted transcriptional regulator